MKDELFFNKIAMVTLTVLLLFFGLPILIDTLWGGGHHAKAHGDVDETNPADFHYWVDYTSGTGGGGGEKIVYPVSFYLQEASPRVGEVKAAICKSCHTLNKGGADGTGPNLWGIMGQQVGSKDGFGYTSAMASLGGTWTYERMDALLANSAQFLPGTAMAQKISKPDQRANIIAYLATLTDGEPLPYPEYVPPAAEGEELAMDAAAEVTAASEAENAASVLEEAASAVGEDGEDGGL